MSKFTRHNCEVIAKVLKENNTGTHDERAVVESIAYDLAVEFAKDNANFNKGIWFDACGFPEMAGGKS